MTVETLIGFRPSPQQLDALRAGRESEGFRSACRVRIASGALSSMLAAGLRAAARRYEILRTALSCPPGVSEPLQMIADHMRTRLVVLDLSALSSATREREVGRAVEVYLSRPLSAPADEPRLEACWFPSPHGGGDFALALPAFRADATSAEQVALAVGLGGTFDPAEELIQYADVSEIFYRLLESDETRAGRSYWRDAWAGVEGVHDPMLPFRAVGGDFRFERLADGAPSREVERALGRAVGTARCDPAGLLLAGWLTLLGRHLGGAESEGSLDISLTFDGRTFEGLEDAVGPFERTVAQPLGPFTDQAPAEAGQRAATDLARAAGHQDFFRRESALPAIGFVRRSRAAPREHLGLSARVIDSFGYSERFSLRLILNSALEVPRIAFEFDRSRFAAIDVERFAGRLAAMLEGSAEHPTRPLGEQSVLTDGERLAVLVEPNQTAIDLMAMPLDVLSFESLRAHPDRIAIETAEVQLSAAMVMRRSEALALSLSGIGVDRGTTVGVCLDRSAAMVISLLGILRAGAAYLALDPGLPAERIALMLEDAAVDVCVTTAARAEMLPASVRRIDPLAPLDPKAPALGVAPPVRDRSLADLAYVLYTSGSTGRPKGVMVSHGAIVNRLLWMERAWPLGVGDRLLQKTTFSFDASIWEIFVPLLSGARLVLAPPAAQRDPEELRAAVVRYGITVLQLVPSMLRPFVELDGIEGATSLARLFSGGEELGADLAARLARRLPSVAVVNLYGPTEASIDVCSRKCPSLARPISSPSVPIGRPIANARVYLLDRRGQLVPPGIEGELHLGGAGLARGYVSRPGLTAERFVPDAISSTAGQRLYRTGDLARWIAADHGFELEYRGRIDHQVKIRGYRIELGEIEAALVRHAEVVDAVAVARPGVEGGLAVVAFFVPLPGVPTPPVDDLRHWLSRSLPDYMVPARLIALPKLPTNAAGKLDRTALPDAELGTAAAESYDAPRNWIEEKLAKLWAEALRLERVGIRDNFFRLGGDSILSIQIVSRAARAGVGITPRQLFNHQTIAELSAVATLIESAPLSTAETGGEVPLSPIQIAFFEQELADPHHYNQALFLASSKPIDGSSLARAADALVATHAAFRTRFERHADGWRQFELPNSSGSAFASFDVSALVEERQALELQRIAARTQTSFDLGRPPLLRLVHFSCGAAAGDRLLIVAHHLAIDGVSWGILLDDLATAYAQAQAGEPIESISVPTPFSAWAAHSAEIMAAATPESAELWLGEAWSEAAPLPVDPEAGANLAGRAETLATTLDERETAALLAACGAFRAQPVELLLAALAAAYSAELGGRSLLVDLEGHGRDGDGDDLDLSRTIGWFTAIQPVALRAVGREIGASVRAIKEQLRAIAGRGVEYGRLRYLGPAATREALTAMPEPQIAFNFLGQVERTLPGFATLTAARESPGPARSPRQERRYLLEIDGGLRGGRLHLVWALSPTLVRERVAAFAQRFVAELARYVEEARRPQPGSLSPSDFPLARMSPRSLADAVASGREIDEILPLSPLQKGLLFHALESQGSDYYLVQWSCSLEGDLDEVSLRAAWSMVGRRHAALRSAFAGSGLDERVQVVFCEADPEWRLIDWRGASPAEQRLRLADFLAADRERGFDVTAPPLFRIALFRIADDRWRFVWTYHHLILDGWCLPIVLDEVFADYQGRAEGKAVTLPPVRPFRDFLAWLARRDPEQAEEFWRRLLADFHAPLQFPVDPALSAAQGSSAGELGSSLSEELTERTTQLARAQGLTLNTLAQGAFAMVLARSRGVDDVIFGATTSGRPPELQGVESMVGLFINSLPVRARWSPDASVLAWLHEIQAQQADARQFEQLSPIRLQELAALPRGTSLFEAIMTFENFPIDRAVVERLDRPGRLHVSDIRQEGRNSNPLSLLVGPGRRLSFHFLYDRTRLAEPAIRRYLSELEAVFSVLTGNPECSLAEIGTHLDALQERLRSQEGQELNRTLRERLRGKLKREAAK